jgi:hypothetical protein
MIPVRTIEMVDLSKSKIKAMFHGPHKLHGEWESVEG